MNRIIIKVWEIIQLGKKRTISQNSSWNLVADNNPSEAEGLLTKSNWFYGNLREAKSHGMTSTALDTRFSINHAPFSLIVTT